MAGGGEIVDSTRSASSSYGAYGSGSSYGTMSSMYGGMGSMYGGMSGMYGGGTYGSRYAGLGGGQYGRDGQPESNEFFVLRAPSQPGQAEEAHPLRHLEELRDMNTTFLDWLHQRVGHLVLRLLTTARNGQVSHQATVRTATLVAAIAAALGSWVSARRAGRQQRQRLLEAIFLHAQSRWGGPRAPLASSTGRLRAAL